MGNSLVGGIAGSLYFGIIENSYSNVTVYTAGSGAGGIAATIWAVLSIIAIPWEIFMGMERTFIGRGGAGRFFK